MKLTNVLLLGVCVMCMVSFGMPTVVIEKQVETKELVK